MEKTVMKKNIRLAAKGHDVTSSKSATSLGGRGYQYQINGFKFDGGPTVITAPYMFDELFAAAGRRREDYFELIPLDPFYRIFDGRATISTTTTRWKTCWQRSIASTLKTKLATRSSSSRPGDL
jgi:phytoene dehydrogenase-like protein